MSRPQRRLAISELVFDDSCYPRVARDPDRVQHLSDVLASEQELPAVLVERTTHIVLGGRHTVAAHQARDETTVLVTLVDVAPSDRLMFAYRQDASAALPYRDVDARKVARLEWERRRANGGSTVEQLAQDLGRSRSTVTGWLADLLERDAREQEQQRQARVVAVAAFVAAGVTQRRIATFFGISQRQVSNDGELATTAHYLSDSRIASAAQSLIHLTLGQGATRDEVTAATNWLLAKTQPELLAAARAKKTLGQIESDLIRAAEFLTAADQAQIDPKDLAALDGGDLKTLRTQFSIAYRKVQMLTESIGKKVP